MIAYPLGVGSTRTRVLEAGAGARALVFVHGLGARADRWRWNLEALADAGYHCHALDLPGHGFADKGHALRYSVPGFADFVRGAMDALGIGAAALIGTSLGGHVAAWLACEAPERVRALVLVGAIGLSPLAAPERAAMARNVRETSRAGIEGKLRYVLCDHALITPAWIEEEHRINTSPGAAEAFDRLGRYLVEPDGIVAHGVVERLAPLTGRIPTLLVWGKADASVPLDVGEQSAAALGVPLLAIDGAGHLPYLERADEFNRAMLDFLAHAWPVTARTAPGPRPETEGRR
jgi:2-hydroxy-6-oxonona-2,4-dienedioate hydrolase